MTTYRVQHSFQGAGGTTKDTYVNTFYIFEDPAYTIDLSVIPSGGTMTNGAALALVISNFWVGANPSGFLVGDYMSARVYGQDEICRFYDVSAPAHTPPVYVDTRLSTAGAPDVQGLPEECAVCLSYKAALLTHVPARRRGRMYIGPLNIDAMDSVRGSDQPVHVAEPFINALNGAAQVLAGQLVSQHFTWRIWSKVNNLGADIIETSVDDAFDTIRGRGTSPVNRTVGSL